MGRPDLPTGGDQWVYIARGDGWGGVQHLRVATGEEQTTGGELSEGGGGGGGGDRRETVEEVHGVGQEEGRKGRIREEGIDGAKNGGVVRGR